jgi:hypothetical protein
MARYTPADLHKLARGLLAAHRELYSTTPRTKNHAVAAARLDGMCDAAYAMGIGGTPTGVRLATKDVLDAGGVRPTAGIAFPKGVRSFDTELANRLDRVLADMS